MAEFWYNSQVHLAIGFSSFFLGTRRHSRMPIWFENHVAADTQSYVSTIEDFLMDWLSAYKEATASITRAQRSYKGQSDKRRQDVVFKVGDIVKVRLEKHQYPKGISPKLAPRWFGPYPIKLRKGKRHMY